MSAAEHIADFLDGQVGQLAGDVDRDMTRVADVRLFALLLGDILGGHAVGSRDLVDDALDGDLGRHVVIEDVGDDLLHGVERRLFVVEEGLRLELFDGALQLADVGLEPVCDVFTDLVGQVQVEKLRFSFYNSDSCFKIRRLDVRDQVLLKAGAETVVERADLLGRTVGGQYDLLVRLVERVEGMEEFLLRTFLAADELDIVDEQNVRIAVLAAEFRHLGKAERLDQLVGEVVAFDIANHHVGIVLLDFVADRVEKMGFSESRVAVEEQGIVRLGRIRRDGKACRVREFVGRSDNEGIKGILIVGVGRVLNHLLDGGGNMRLLGRF